MKQPTSTKRVKGKVRKVMELAHQLQKDWMKVHKDWRTPVWGYFRDEAERILPTTKSKK